MTITISGTTGIAGVDGSAGTPAVQGTDTNTGIYFGSDTISFAEGGAEAVQIDSSANLKFNSGYGSVATAYGCRAWVNFDGTTNTGGFCTIRASGNVTSVADNGTGDYTVNFTNAMPDADYSTIAPTVLRAGTGQLTTVMNWARTTNTEVLPTTTAVRLSTISGATTALDSSNVYVAVFR